MFLCSIKSDPFPSRFLSLSQPSTLIVYRPNLTARQREALRNAFLLLDHDHSGTIETSQLGTVMSALGMACTQDKLIQIAEQMDSDGSGEIKVDGRLLFFHFHALPSTASELPSPLTPLPPRLCSPPLNEQSFWTLCRTKWTRTSTTTPQSRRQRKGSRRLVSRTNQRPLLSVLLLLCVHQADQSLRATLPSLHRKWWQTVVGYKYRTSCSSPTCLT